VTGLKIEFREHHLHLPDLGLWLDPHEPKPGKVFVSHAHSDHIAEHREVILSAPTAKLMRARLSGNWEEHALNFFDVKRFETGDKPFDLTLLPAGHIFGSAMAHIHVDGGTLLYTGDFKLRQGLSAEPCQPCQADVLIMETTYGRPQYVFPPTTPVMEGVIRFCREALDNGETAVLLGYSLGKSQELLCGLADAGLPLMLHGAVYKLTQIYEQFGQCFPPYEPYESGAARGKVLLCPPYVVNSSMLRNLGKSRSAILTGWAVDPNCRFRYQCDAAFPLSDHADFPDLLEMVKKVQPKKVYTLHGFAAEFAETLRELGYDAQSLSENEQLALRLDSPKRQIKNRVRWLESNKAQSSSNGVNRSRGPLFIEFARACSQIGATTSKLEKVRILANYLSSLAVAAGVSPDVQPGILPGTPETVSGATPVGKMPPSTASATPAATIALAATWFSGRPFPPGHGKNLQLGWAVLRNAMCAVGNIEESALWQIYLKHSDLGETANELFQGQTVEPSLTLVELDQLFHELLAARGPLAKTPILIRALERSGALEAKYLVKIITGDLRIGLKEGLVEEAVAAAFNKSGEQVRQTNLLLGDIGETAQLASENRLGDASLIPFRPVKLMLASPEETAADVWKRMTCRPQKKSKSETEIGENETCVSAVWLEDKYDGIRCQLHKKGGRVALYSRDLKDVTNTFSELADAARKGPDDYILDGEIVAMRGEEILPFADLQRRLGRREGDLFMREEVPIRFVAFDLVWLNSENYLDRPLRERRQHMEALKSLPSIIGFTRITQANSPEEINVAFDSARAHGNEGLMIKNPESLYTPGRRGLAWLKLKKALATLDCVVVGAEYGHGKRNKVLSDYTFAVRDEATGALKIIGKAYSGLTDVEIAQLTEHFHKHAIRQHGRYFEVEPETVLEIAFDKIQHSDRHDSGLAMRFPRIVRIRTDKTAEDIDTLTSARKLAESGKSEIRAPKSETNPKG
jgi:DNA ligase-1